MINRDLMQRQMFRNGGGVVPMQDGGEPTFKEKILAVGRGVVPMAGSGAASMQTLSREDLQLFLQNYPGYLENNSLYDERGVLNPEVRQEVERLKEGNVKYYDPLRPAPSAPSFVPTPSRQPQVSPEQLQDFLRNNPGYLEEKGSVYGDDGNVNPEVLEPQPVYGMQEGGMAPMGMPPQGMAPQGAMMPEMAQAQQAGMDPAILEQMLAQASQGIGSLDEAEDYEQVMNMMTGTSATIAERRMELADLVGDEDAQQTPDSVLTLVQPVIMMAKTDEGIGGLAQDQMTEAVTGDMAGGIMSTIDMGAQEGPAPVNFRYGGAVQYMEPGGVAMNEQQQKDFDLLQQEYELNKNFMGQLIDKDAQAKAMQGQRDMTQAQMLFDLANTGLAIAAPGPRTMSVAEKLAYAAQQTELFPRIGARAAELGKFKQEQDQESRQYDLAAAQGAMTERSARRADERELAAAIAKEKRDLADAIAKKDRKFQVVNGALYEVIGADLVKLIDKIEDPQNFGSGFMGNAVNILTSDDAVDLATRYGDGKTTEAENNRIEFSLAIYTAPVPVYDKELNKDVLSPGNELPNLWKNAKNKRTGNVDTPSNVDSNVDGTIPAYLRKPPVGADQGVADQSNTNPDKRNIEIEGPTYDSLISEMDNLSGDLTGKSSALKNWGNRTAEFFSGSLFFPQAEKTQSLVDSLNTVASMVLMRTQVNDRPPDSFRKEVKKIFPKTGEFFKGSENALNKLNNIVAFFNAEIAINNARDWASVKPDQQYKIQEQGAMLETYRDTYLSLRDRLAAEENKGQGNKPDFRQYLSPEAREEWEKKYGNDGEKKKLTLDAPSSPEMTPPALRERVPTQVNTVRPEAVLSVEQPPVPAQVNEVSPEAVLSVDKPPVPENNETFEARKGKLRLPALGTVTAKFGERRVDSNVPWEGIFISSDQGTSVNSIAGGTVVYSDWLRGFGNLIIIDHGEGYSSLYGNNEDLWAREGDQIEAGDQLGTVGNSGGNTGPGVYFEVRHNSKLLNPMEWVNIDEAKLKD
jgi:murein DD-endopeptidase MepM/ murein hydrolase activator NlpD